MLFKKTDAFITAMNSPSPPRSQGRRLRQQASSDGVALPPSVPGSATFTHNQFSAMNSSELIAAQDYAGQPRVRLQQRRRHAATR